MITTEKRIIAAVKAGTYTKDGHSITPTATGICQRLGVTGNRKRYACNLITMMGDAGKLGRTWDDWGNVHYTVNPNYKPEGAE